MSSKMQNWALGTLKSTPSSSHLHPCNIERLRRWNYSFIYPQADMLLSFTQTEQQELSPFTAVTSVKPEQTIGMGLRSTSSHSGREGESLVRHSLSSVSTPCLTEPAGLQQCTDKQCQDDQILSELLGVDHRNFASQALTLRRRPHIFVQL